MTIFKKMVQEGCKPTLIAYSIILNVYGKMGVPWNKILSLIKAMKKDGASPNLYTYNTLISCSRSRCLYEEAWRIFGEMKSIGFTPDMVTYNALLDVYGWIFCRKWKISGSLQVL